MKRENRTYCFYQNRISLILIILILSSCIGKTYAQATGFANITISTATSNGSWSPTLASAVNTFIPNGNITSATISATEITSKLATGDVFISTTCSTCSGAGTISITNAITYTGNTSHVLNINGQNDISINSSIDFSNTQEYKGKVSSLVIKSNNGNIISKSTINTSHTSNHDDEIGGDISLEATNGSVTINGDISTSSGSGTGDIAGNVNISGNSGVTINAKITSTAKTTLGILTITDNNINQDASNQGQTIGIITVGSFVKLGTGVFQLKGANAWTGNTTITAGYLKLGADNSVPPNSSIVFNGGYYQPNGFNSTVKTFRILADSYIIFDAAQSSTITFDSVLYNSTANKSLTILGWQGFSSTTALTKSGALKSSSTAIDFVTTNGALQNAKGITQYGQILTSDIGGSGGLKGKIFASSNLTGTILSTTIGKIQFLNGAIPYTSKQISTKEIIPGIAKQL